MPHPFWWIIFCSHYVLLGGQPVKEAQGTAAARVVASRVRACRQNSAVTRSLARATGRPSCSHIRADDSTETRLPGMRVLSRTMRAPSGSRCPRRAGEHRSQRDFGGWRRGIARARDAECLARLHREPAPDNEGGTLRRPRCRSSRCGVSRCAGARVRRGLCGAQGTRRRSAGGPRGRSTRCGPARLRVVHKQKVIEQLRSALGPKRVISQYLPPRHARQRSQSREPRPPIPLITANAPPDRRRARRGLERHRPVASSSAARHQRRTLSRLIGRQPGPDRNRC